jgi:NADPH-dependent glutamate synthase beta subunit-like oxidoreductase
VLGGGNLAIDAARACKRLGANATIVYRRTKEDMSALPYDVDNAEAEGIGFELLTQPMELVKEGDRAVKLKCQRMKLGLPDGSGRRRPVPINGEVFERPVTTLIMGQIQEPDYADPLSLVGIDPGPTPIDGKMKLAIPGLFAGGDANKLGHVTVAIAQGRMAAEEIDIDLGGATPPAPPPLIFKDKLKLEFYEASERRVQGKISVDDRFEGQGINTPEVNTGLSQEDAIAEAKRCFSCGMCMDCDNCWMFCQDQAVEKLSKTRPTGDHYLYKHDLCTGCEKCAEECPCGYLKMV